MDHLVIAPIALPMLAGAAMVLLGERRRRAQEVLALTSTAALMLIALALLAHADAPVARAYRLGDWPAAFGIVLVLDRLSAAMVALVAVLGLAALLFSLARWERAGVMFHPLFQFQLMGLAGTFLTGDLFNLFVFFEVTLAASYGLALHGSGPARVRAGLHYLVVNLLASLLFLVGVSVVYGISGTLGMADLAARMAEVAPEDRALLEAGLAVMGVAFLIKAAAWPLGFWLSPTYSAAAAPCAAILSLLSKVGVYAVIRLWLLVFGEGAGESAGFGGVVLLAAGLLTVLFGTIVALASQDVSRLAGAAVLVSSGTLLAALGAGAGSADAAAVTAGALFYLATSALALGALFLLVELLERGRDPGADVLAVTRQALGVAAEEEAPDETEEAGVALPGALAALGLAFVVAVLLLAGLPPLSGFLAKVAILAPLLGVGTGAAGPGTGTWLVLAALLLSGLALLLAAMRAGIELFWTTPPATPPRVAAVELAPVLLLLGLCLALTVAAGPALAYLEEAARALHAPAPHYIRSVMGGGGG
jgi:multicomponent K+:H+ antiporter subunit D